MNEKRDRIQEIKDNLYSRKNKGPGTIFKLRYSKKEKKGVKNSWGTKKEGQKDNIFRIQRKTPSVFFIIFMISIIFFIGSISITSFYLFFDNQKVVSNHLDVIINGPNLTRSGDDLNFIIKLDNVTKKKINNVNFLVRYPKSTYDPIKKEALHIDTSNENKTILAGGFISQRFSSILSGSIGEEKKIDIEISYQVDGFSNILTLRRVYKIGIESSPVEVTATVPTKVVSNTPFEIKVNIKSNNTSSLENLILLANLPQGLKILELSEKMSSSSKNNSNFLIKNLSPNEEKNITIKALLIGQNNDNKFFSFSVGDATENLGKIKSLFSKSEYEVTVKRPDIDLSLTAESKRFGFGNVFFEGEEVDINFNLVNNLKTAISNLKLTVELPDNFIKQKDVSSIESFYDSNNNTILWDRNTNKNFKNLASHKSISGGFKFNLISVEDIAGYIVDPEFKVKFKAQSLNLADTEEDSTPTESFEETFKIATRVDLDVGIANTNNPLAGSKNNTPKVGSKSFHAIYWKIYNSSSDIKNVIVKTKLPHYVKFTKNISPKNSYITYDEERREVSLRFNKIEAGIGYNTDPKTVFFEIEYIPTTEHLNNTVPLIYSTSLTAYEDFTERDIKITNERDVEIEVELDER